jgi:DNA-directed RNA polymerase II subunit RPB2
MDNAEIWTIIDHYFKDTENPLVKHQIESYNYFYKNDIYNIFADSNPIKIVADEDGFQSHCNLYLGGKKGDKVYFGKPVIYDEKGEVHFMCPNEARLRNMTYAMTIHYDVEVEVITILGENEEPSLEGNAFNRFMEEGDLEIIENDEEVQRGGAPKKAQIKKKDTVKNTNQIKTTLRNMADITEESRNSVKANNGVRSQTFTYTIEKRFLGRFPIMVQSEFCILHGLTRENRFSMGECKNDQGGYFIIDGKEKVVVSQEKFGDNMLYVREYSPIVEDDEDAENNEDDIDDDSDKEIKLPEFLYSAQIVSVSENISKFARTFSIKMVGPTKSLTNMNIVVNIPNVKKPVPLFIVMRALGIISDKDIISTCVLDIDKYESLIDLLIPSIHDSGTFNTQESCLNYIGLLTKGRTIFHAHEILVDYLLPHVGQNNYQQKAYYIGYMVFRILLVQVGIDKPTDRDNFKYKRIELVGPLIYNLFNEYYKIQSKKIHLGFESTMYHNKGQYLGDLMGLIKNNYEKVFDENKDLDKGVRKAFKGNWGAQVHTKRVGVVQDLDRLSFNSMMSHLRRVVLPIDPSLKIVEPRKLHCSQWGFIDPIDTPDGSNIGFHKNLALSTQITRGFPKSNMIKWLSDNIEMTLIHNSTPYILSKLTKIFVNGGWIGSTENPIDDIEKIRLFKRNGLLPIYCSASFDIKDNSIYIYTDGGRLCRPIFYVKGNVIFNASKKRNYNDISWNNLITGSNIKKVKDFNPNECKIYSKLELYGNTMDDDNKAIIDYIDCSETENAMITTLDNMNGSMYTHCEIHESLILGMMGNQITFPESNPMARNLFSCGQSKQACSLYHTNYQMRMDKTAMVLNYGQIPLLKSRYSEYINNDENSYGENTIVAIMCFTGYNVEDAILINEGSLNRGLFRTSYFSTYETHEEKANQNDDVSTEKIICNINDIKTIQGKKGGYSYEKLDSNGLIREGELVDDKTILVGLTSNSTGDKESKLFDISIVPKKGQLGTVNKSYITEGEEGERIAKVRVVHQRIPSLGDKFASRVGQKGTVGMIIREQDMPFTKNGMRPDIIINPHAIPSRMTIGQLVESITGKACAIYGGFGDATAFNQKGSKVGLFGGLLSNSGYHSNGNEILYNGMTGEQIESDIFIGPTYYMRLKHMVKDKINYRREGPRTQLTRQAVGGRANDGGLRIGEMEKDSIISYGATNFLTESMMERGDKYHIAVCNKSGVTAIYNPLKNIFFSPIVDGPLKFTGKVADDIKIDNISQFGRSFSVVSIPYTFKLLMQELGCMNLQLRLITEDNIGQLDNLNSSLTTKEKEKAVEKDTIDETVREEDTFYIYQEDEKREVEYYGWTKIFSEERKEYYWYHEDTKETVWTEPLEIRLRNQILNRTLVMSYEVGDIINYLGEENTSPNRRWKIDDKFTSVLNKELMHLTSLDDEDHVLFSIPYDVSIMRRVIPNSPDFPPPGSPDYPPPNSPDDPPPGWPNSPDDPPPGWPNSPDHPPPGWDQQKGGYSGDSKLLLDEMVNLSGDILPSLEKRLWYITKIGGKSDVTITTDDTTGLGANDIVRTVHENQLSRPDLVETIQPQTNPGIIFAPVIKVVNGNDNSTGEVRNQEETENVTELKKEKDFTPKKRTEDQIGGEDKKGGILDGVIDFTNLIVKKLI